MKTQGFFCIRRLYDYRYFVQDRDGARTRARSRRQPAGRARRTGRVALERAA